MAMRNRNYPTSDSSFTPFQVESKKKSNSSRQKFLMERQGSHPDPRTPNNRLGRLLRQRELRKYVRSSSLSQGSSSGDSERSVGESDVISQTEDSLVSDQGKTEKLQRLLVVSNRLPVSANLKSDGTWNLEITSGGLVSALIGVKVFEAKWIGWPGVCLTDKAEKESLTISLAKKDCIPVFMDEETFNQYYNGYCNNILWPLFHYIGLPQEDRLSTTQGFKTQFDAYKKANQMFADVVKKHYKEGDIVWCHDYHLMYLPKCLKDNDKNMKVGWFLHTPFPSSELHRTLPARAEVLRAVLEADIIGFHTYDYARHFVSSCTRVLGLECTPAGVEHQGRLTRVVAYPIGMDAQKFISVIESPTTKEDINKLKQRYAGRKVMLGVDRLDMVKGIPQKLLAFERFLEDHPDWRDKVVLIQIAIPTRTDVPEYQKLASQVHKMVGRINGRFGSLSGAPINHLDCTLDFQNLCALYAITDVVLVTSLRDGMNLVSYEFVACQSEKKGVLILSEFAGAAQSLGAGAILVNPWNVVQVSAAIATALNMPDDEREKRHRLNFMHVITHSSQEWAEMFVGELNDSIIEAQVRTTQIPPSLPVGLAIEKYKQSANRLLILGFNATLSQSVQRGDQINDMELKLHPELKEPLRKLCNDPKTTVLILSGCTKTALDKNFSEFDIWLAAENGFYLRHTTDDWLTVLPECADMDWVPSIRQVFEYFTERTPRSHFDIRATSLLWNYKYSDVEFGQLQAKDFMQHLKSGQISSSPVEVIQGARSVEVRAAGLTKGAGIDRILGEIVYKNGIKSPINYVLCVGHFLGKDEDIYSFFEPAPNDKDTVSLIRCLSRAHPAGGWITPSSDDETKGKHAHPGDEECLTVLDLKGENYFSCSVARLRSNARYLIGSSDEVVTLLKEMAAQLG